MITGCLGDEPTGTVSAAPGSSTSSGVTRPSADATATCEVLVRIDRAASEAKSPEQGLQILRSFASQFDGAVAAAPAAQRSDVSVIIEASRQALNKRDLSPLATDEVARAGARLAVSCDFD